MSDKRYTEEFKSEAIKQITERGHSVVRPDLRRSGTDIQASDVNLLQRRVLPECPKEADE